MRCCILYNQPRKDALPDELDILDQAEWVESNLRKMNITTFRLGITSSLMNEIASLKNETFDFVFNLAESIENKGELLYFIPAILNMHNIPYTGNPLEAMFLTTSKPLTARILTDAGISSPRTFLPSQFHSLVKGRKYIIKPSWEDGSMGITPDSVFTWDDGMEKILQGKTDSHWMIQDFIDGSEYNVSVIAGPDGPEVLPLAEMTFVGFGPDRPKIVDYTAKWVHGSFECENTIREFPGDKMEPLLRKRIEKTALRCWEVFGLKGYARIDMRVDENGEPFVIEINANPCISEDGGFVAATRAGGYEFTEILQRIINDMNY